MDDKKIEKFELSENEIEDLIDEVNKITLRNKKEVKKKLDLDTALGNTIQEFLTSFILIGYDINGDRVVIRSEDSSMTRDALKSFLLNYIQMFMYED